MISAVAANARSMLERVTAQHAAQLLFLVAAIVLVAGVGLRDPWPADEPRFAAIARDMLASGDWLIPRIGGDLYADKPPLFFWLLAASFWLTGSVRAGFLMPTMIAGFVTLITVYDLTSRLYSRRTGVWAGLLLLLTIQFSLEFKSARIDPVLTMFTTLGLYGLLRHLLLGPRWGWYAFGGFASGVGIITKGVGFLPLLILLPYALFTRLGWQGAVLRLDARWILAALGAAAAVALWLVPLLALIAASDSSALYGYRDELLLGQTIDRYLDAPGHLKPWWYFVLAVIPWAWLPISVALPWLYGHWRDALKARDLRIGMLLGWIGLVLLFFSLSSGKRGVYVLPAVPALAIATAPYVEAVSRITAAHRLAWNVLLAATLSLGAAAVGLGWFNPDALGHALDGVSVSPSGLVAPFALWAAACLIAVRPRRGLLSLAVFFVGLWAIYGWYLWPKIDVARSGRIIMDRAYAHLPPEAELGIAAQKESLLLQARGALTNFGHRRTDAQQEQFDAASWLSARSNRFLIIPAERQRPCFDESQAVSLGYAHGIRWMLEPHAAAESKCAERGRPANAIPYRAPE